MAGYMRNNMRFLHAADLHIGLRVTRFGAETNGRVQEARIESLDRMLAIAKTKSLDFLLFAGDLFLGVKVRVARPGEHPRVLAKSLRAIAALSPLVMFDSHRGQVPEPVASLNAKADWLDETIARIDQLAAQGINDHSIRRAVLGAEDSTFYFSAGDLSRINFVRAVRRSA